MWDFVPYLTVPPGDAVPRSDPASAAAGVIASALGIDQTGSQPHLGDNSELVEAEVAFLLKKIQSLLNAFSNSLVRCIQVIDHLIDAAFDSGNRLVHCACARFDPKSFARSARRTQLTQESQATYM